MKRFLVSATALTCLSFSATALAAKVTISCGAVGQEMEMCKQAVQEWSKKSGNEVNVVSTPNSTTERLALYQQILAAKSPDIDVFMIDVIWPGMIGEHLVDLKGKVPEPEQKMHFPSFLENNTINGKLVALPWFIDAGLLYYRKDLLEKYNEKVPTTWDELAATAQKIQDGERKAGTKDMWGFVFQGKAYEGLTCDALEWVSSFGGGTIVDASGKVTINNPSAVKAVDTVASWVDKFVPKGVVTYAEEESRGVFQSGKAVFMRNWPYAWALANEKGSKIKDKVAVSILPAGPGGKSAATLGGWSLAVSKYSKSQDAAIDLIRFLTGKVEQKRRALKMSNNPSIPELYDDKEIAKAMPFMIQLRPTFQNAVPRPAQVTGSKYNRVSSEFWTAVHNTLNKKGNAEQNLKQLEQKLNRIGRNGKW